MIDLRSGEESREEKHYARLTEYIRKEYMHDISLDSAGEALGMSPSYIGLVFRKAGETSFLKYLTDIRMEETKRLLTTTDLTLREIGDKVVQAPEDLVGALHIGEVPLGIAGGIGVVEAAEIGIVQPRPPTDLLFGIVVFFVKPLHRRADAGITDHAETSLSVLVFRLVCKTFFHTFFPLFF